MFAIGLPGEAPRIVAMTTDMAFIAKQLREGEVAAPCEGPGDWIIAADGQSVSARDKPLGELQAEKWRAVKRRRDMLLAAGAAVPGVGTFQTDEKSMANIHEAVTGALLAGATGQPFTIEFTLADNSRPVLSAAQMIAVGKLVGERKSAIHAFSQDVLRAAIFGAASAAELDAIDIEAGWPE